MRIVDPAQLKPPVESVAAFSCDPDDLATRLRAIDVDQFSAPGPARLGAIELADGSTVGVMIHEHGRFAEILAQLSTNVESTLVESFRVLGVSASSVDWMRDGIDQAAIIGAMKSGVDGHERVGALRVELAPQFAGTAGDMVLTPEETRALTLLILRLAHAPDLATTIGDTGIHMMQVPHTILADGTEIAPLAVFYQIELGRSVAILDVQRIAASDIFITGRTFLDVAMNDVAAYDLNTGDRDQAALVLQHRPKTVASAVVDARELLSRAS